MEASMTYQVTLRLDEIEYLINVLNAEVESIANVLTGSLSPQHVLEYEAEREMALGILKKLH